MGFTGVFNPDGTPNLFACLIREEKLVGGIKLQTTSCWEKRSGDGRNGIGGVRSGTLNKGRVVVMMVMMMKVMRRRCVGRSCARIRRGMAKGKLEEIPDFRFGVRFGVSYGHVVRSVQRNENQGGKGEEVKGEEDFTVHRRESE